MNLGRSRPRAMSLGVLCLAFLLTAAGLADALPDAAREGDADEVSALLRDGADVNAAHADGMTALHWAAEAGHAEIAQILLSAGADAESVTRLGDYTPLHLAARNGHADVVTALLTGGSRCQCCNDHWRSDCAALRSLCWECLVRRIFVGSRSFSERT